MLELELESILVCVCIVRGDLSLASPVANAVPKSKCEIFEDLDVFMRALDGSKEV